MSHITAILEKNPLLANILDQHYDAIMLLTPGDLVCVYHNQPARTLFNLNITPGLEFSLKELFLSNLDEKRWAMALGKESVEHFLLDRFPLRRHPDDSVMCGIKGKVLLLENQPWLFCTFRDISERIRLEERNQTIQAHLIQANKMTSLGTMASGVAHEINNPNNYILSNAQMVADIWADLARLLNEHEGFDSDSVLGGLEFAEAVTVVPKLLSGIVEGSGRINAIVSRMKEYSRPLQQRNKDRVSINHVVQFAISMMEREIKRKTEQFSSHLAEDLPDIWGYEEQLEQVLINLIDNALHALPDMTAAVTVTTSLDDSGRVQAEVADEGLGISDSARARIFEPFYTTRQDQGGTGLGLYISYGIVADHDGQLSVRSRPGQGTVMTLHFPVCSAEGDSHAR